MTTAIGTRRRGVERGAVAVLATLAYLPALLSAPGRMPADTKLYLYLDPDGLVSRAPKAWDPSQFGGWVPHQMIQYLWPAGPWFWVCERVGLPDWVAHRLWLATLLFLAGLGVLLVVRALGLPLRGALVAALIYQLSPYILPYVSRTSAMLLPWAALGWLLLLTMKAVRHGGWRYPALLALVVCTAAGVNATAFAVIIPGPMLWVAFEWRARRVSTRQVVTASARIAVLSIAVSVWWIAMLAIQGRYGANVLAYSETLDAVAYTSNSVEVMRGLGYWLFYVRDPYAAATSSSLAYQQSLPLIAVGFALMVLCLLGLTVTRFAHRKFAIALVTVGLLIAVGVHPYPDPSPAASAVRSSGLALALRSSTRAIPLITLGLGLGAAALVTAVRRHDRRRGRWLAVLTVTLVAANLPSLWTGDLVDPALDRDSSPPAAWLDAAAQLDAGDTTSRVLQLPGAEFGAFRWGYTVDPPLAGITRKPLLTRDLLPLGSAQLMDLLYALDNRVQSEALDPAALAPVARLLAADTIWISGDMAFERFRTLRPEIFAAYFDTPPAGVGTATAYGEPRVNNPDIPMVDEQSLSDGRIGEPIAPVLLAPIEEPVGLARIGGRVVVLDGSGDGLIDAAAAGLLHGDEAVLYADDLSADDWKSLPDDTVFIITDSNRDREMQWRGSQDTLGMTEAGGPAHDGQRLDPGAVRLPVFGDDDASAQTVASLAGGMTVQATTYGEPFSFMPEYRAAMAVDGDPATDWRVGQRWDPIGERLTLTGAATTQLHLLQSQGAQLTKMISAVDIAVDGVSASIRLDESSLSGAGQTITIPSGNEISITITAVSARPGAPDHGEEWVGLAEVGPVAQEWVRPPMLVQGSAPADSALALVFRRETARATDRWRRDPEPVMARAFTLPTALAGRLSVQLQLAARSSDAALDQLAGRVNTPTANRRLTGVPGARASAAFDGDPTTRYLTPFNTAVGSTITVPLEPGSRVSSFRMLQPTEQDVAPITELRVSAGGIDTLVKVPPADSDGFSTITFHEVVTDEIALTVAAVDAREITERRMGVTADVPAAIAEITGLPLAAVQHAALTCRDDLLSLDGVALPLLVDNVALLAGKQVTAVPCAGAEVELGAGAHELLSAAGTHTGIDVDAVSVLPPTERSATSAPTVHIDSYDATSVELTIAPCARDCWLIFGEGYNRGWEATAAGVPLDAPVPVSGGSNGWRLAPSTTPTHVTISFAPQRQLNWAIAGSAVALLICIGLVAWPSARRRLRPRAEAPRRAPVAPALDLSHLAAPWGRSTRQSATRGAVFLVVTSGVFIGPAWGVAALVVGAALVHSRRLRLAALTAVLGLGVFGLLVMGVVVVRDTPAGTGWAGQLEPLHQSGVFLMLLLASSLAAKDDVDVVDH